MSKDYMTYPGKGANAMELGAWLDNCGWTRRGNEWRREHRGTVTLTNLDTAVKIQRRREAALKGRQPDATNEGPWAKVRRLGDEHAAALRDAWASSTPATVAEFALLSPTPPGMLCGSRLTASGERCLLDGGHLGDHDPAAPSQPPAPGLTAKLRTCANCGTKGVTSLYPDGTFECGDCGTRQHEGVPPQG